VWRWEEAGRTSTRRLAYQRQDRHIHRRYSAQQETLAHAITIAPAARTWRVAGSTRHTSACCMPRAEPMVATHVVACSSVESLPKEQRYANRLNVKVRLNRLVDKVLAMPQCLEI